MATTYTTLSFTCPVTARIEQDGKAVVFQTIDQSASATVWIDEITDEGKETLRRLVRDWDFAEEAEVRGEHVSKTFLGVPI
ncbi:MAG: hypothetical protein ACYCZM_11990 [Acidimicrobiales bacterium]